MPRSLLVLRVWRWIPRVTSDVADTGNATIRKITPDGAVTTIGGLAGYGNWGYADGTGSAARFFQPCGVAVDREGNVYVADYLNSSIRVGVAPVVQVVALEVTQVIQDWSNSIPLIEGKDTYVRAHLQLLPNSEWNGVRVSEALLYGTGPNGPLPGSPVLSIYPNNSLLPLEPGNSLVVQTHNAADPDVRGHFANSLNFRLPPEWLSGTITLQLAWPGGLEPTNGLPQDCTVPVTFMRAAVPQIKFFDVTWIDPLSAPVTSHQVGPGIEDLPRRVLSCYPVASVAAAFGTLPPLFGLPQLQDVNVMIEGLRWCDSALGAPPPLPLAFGNWIYHGAIAPNDTPLAGDGLTLAIPSLVSCEYVGATYGYGRQTVSHELGHNLGIQHDVSRSDFGVTLLSKAHPTPFFALGACCEQGPLNYEYPLFEPFHSSKKPTLGPMTLGQNSLIYGLDTLTLRTTIMEPVVAPTNSPTVANYYFDLMSQCTDGDCSLISTAGATSYFREILSFCTVPDCASDNSFPEQAWPSSVTYAALLSSINTTFPYSPPVPQGGPRPKGGGGAENYLIVRGAVDFNAGTARFLPCLPVSTATLPPGPPPGTTFLLEALDGSGAVVQAIPFALEPSIVEAGDTSQTAGFIDPCQPIPPSSRFSLWYNGMLLAALTASPHAPTLTLTTPNGGQNFAADTVNLAWSGNDADGDTLTYTVQYSTDAGATWRMLAVDWPGQSLGIDSSGLAATTNALIRVIASDGFNTASAQSAATFTVQPHAPRVSVNAPRDGSVFIGNVQLFLDASAIDMQDGALKGTNVQWSSSIDGALGSGAIVTFNAKRLSEGRHTITVTAIDSAGLTNSAVTHLLELHYPPPQLTIQKSPGQTNATLSWPSYYTNYVLQASTGLASGWAVITNNPPVVIGGQKTVTVGISGPNSFFRLMVGP